MRQLADASPSESTTQNDSRVVVVYVCDHFQDPPQGPEADINANSI